MENRILSPDEAVKMLMAQRGKTATGKPAAAPRSAPRELPRYPQETFRTPQVHALPKAAPAVHPLPLPKKLPTYRSTLDGMAEGAMPLSTFAQKRLDDARLSPVRTKGLTAERDRLDAKLTQSQNRINAGEGADVDGMKRDQYRINDLSRQLDTQNAERYEADLASKRAAMERKAGPVSGAKLSPDRRTEDLLQTYPGYGPSPRDKSGVTDAARYLSDPEFRKAAKGRMKLDNTLDDALAPLDYMTETERNTLVSYVQAGDLQSAEQYKALLDRTLNARRQQKQSATMERTAREHPVLGTVNNLGSSLGSGFALAGTAGQAVKNLVTGKDEPTDYNSKWFKSAHAVNDTAKGLHRAAYDAAGGGTWGEIAAGSADMGLSLGQMVAKMPLGPAALPMMALTAGGQSSLGALERGASTGQALAYGTATGLVEALTEKLPLDALFDLAKTGKSGVKAVLGSVLKQMGSEASQEMVSELADNLADKAIMGTRSEYENYVSGLVSQGMDEGQARQAATKQYYLYNVAKAGLGGAVTGGVMAGGANIIGSIGNKNAQAPLRPNRLLTGKEQFEQSQMQNGQKNTASTNTGGIKQQYTFLSDKNEQEQKLADVYDNVVASHKGVIIQQETLEKYRAINNNPALKLISAIKEYYDDVLNGTSVDVSLNGGVVEVKFENDGKHKSVGWRMKPEKAATFESLRKMFQQAEYAYSEENRDANEISSIPQFDYFVTNANIEGSDIPVKLQVRNLAKDGENLEKRYYTHNLQNYKKRGSDSPVADTNGIGIDSNAYASSSTPNVAQAAPEVNTEDMQFGGKDAAVPQSHRLLTGKEQFEQSQMQNGQKNTAEVAALPKMSMADFTDAESSVWNNVEYDDTKTKADLQGRAHQEMVDAGQLVHIPESTLAQTGEAFPDLRTVKKSERVPMLKQKMNELKSTLRGFLCQLKGGSYEFEVNGNILEARLYDTGIKEVMEKVTQDKASMLYHSEELFQNARYLYSTPDYDGNPNIYRWNYFYTPVKIGGETVGVRIAVRDMVPSAGGGMDSQIYNWGIKKGTTLDGGGPGGNPNATGVSSVVPSGTPLDGGQRGSMPDQSGVSSGVPSDITLPQEQSGVNTENMQNGGEDTAVPQSHQLLTGKEQFEQSQVQNEQKKSAEVAEGEGWLVPLSESERASLSTGKKNFVADTVSDVVSFVRNALKSKGGAERLYMGKVSDKTAQMVMESTGVDIAGYAAILPGDSVQHTFNHHGDPNLESARGQRAVTPEDIAMIPRVIATPDSVRLSGEEDNFGRPVLIFSKLVGDNYITAQAVTDGRHALTTNSIWVQKKKGPLDTTHNTDVTTDPVLNAQSVPPSDLSYDPTLSQWQSGVNREDMQNGGKDAPAYGNIAPLQVNNVDNAQNASYNRRNGGVLDAGSEYGAENAGDRVPGVQMPVGEMAGRGTDGRGNPVVSGRILLDPKVRKTLHQQGVVDLELQDSSEDSALFSSSLGIAKKSNPFGAFVDGQDAETLRKDGTRTFLSADRMAGVAVKQDGDIVGVFKHWASKNKGVVRDLLTTAIANGGTKLDCYGMRLGDMYAQCGFIPVARMDFNPEYAPADWKPEFGTPDVIFWRHNGDSAETVSSRWGAYPVYSAEDIQKLPTFTDYDQAGAYRDMMQGGTVGSAKSGFDQYIHLQNQTDKFHPDGEEPRARQVDVPTTDFDGRRIPKSAATIAESAVTPDNAVGVVEDEIAHGNLSFDTITDVSASARAQKDIDDNGFEGVLALWREACSRGVVSKDIIATGQLLLKNAYERKDGKAIVDILVGYTSASTNSAQAMQAQRMLKKLSPQGQLYGITRSVQNLQGELNKRMGDKAPTLTIGKTVVDDFLSAKDQDGRDKAMLDIRQNVADQVPATWMDKWNAWRYMAMLANPRTHIRNTGGNVGFQPVRILKDRVGAVIEAGVNKMGGKIERTKSFAYSPELYRATWGDYAVSKDLLEQGSRYHDNQGEIEKLKPIFNKGIPTKALEQVTGKTFKSGIMENIRKGNSWLLEVEDAFFKRMTYADALAGSLRAHGVTAADMASGTVDAGLLDRARAYATQEALKATYQDRNAVSDIAATFGRGSKTITGKAVSTLSEGVLPFRRTPANILVRGAEYSPLGLAKSLTYDLYKVKKGDMTAAEAIDGIASGLTGSALLALGALLFSSGLVSPGGGDDKKEDAMRDLTGGQDYALQLPGGGSVTLDWLAPESLPFFMGVELADSIGQNGLSAQNLGDTLGAVADPMLEMSMLQSLNDALDSISYSDNKLQALVSSALVSYLGQAVPTIGGQIERTAEDKRMTTYTDKNNKWLSTDMQYALGKSSARIPIPYVDLQQIPYIDAWGRTEPTGSLGARAANNFLNPAFVSKSNVTAVDSEVLRLYRKIGAGEVVPDRAPKYLTISGEKIDLDKNQYLQYAKERGSASLETANLMIDSTVYKGLTDEGKASAISGSYEYADAIAKKNLGLGYLPDEWVLEAEKRKPEQRVNFLLARQVLSDVGSGEGATDRKRNALISMKNMTAEEKAATGMALGIDTRKLDYSSAEALTISAMPESTREKAKAAKKARISDKVFIAAYEAQKGAESDKDRNGETIPNSESMNKKNAIDRAAKSLTFEQRKVLYDLFGVSKKVQMYAPR